MPRTSKEYTKNIAIIGAFFFIFGFISWVNGTLIPYLKIACELEDWQAYLVTFAFYISYTVMATPSSRILQKSGMLKGMRLGLIIMALGCCCFIPAALTRKYIVFLFGLFVVGTGLTLLQTAVNPYITLLGPAQSAARRISIMGVCNKLAGIIAPLVMGAFILKNANGLLDELTHLSPTAKATRLDELSHAVITPYACLATILLLIAVLIGYAHLPEINAGQQTAQTNPTPAPTPQLVKGFIAIFFAVGVEVMAGDTIGGYGLYLGINLDTAKHLTSWTLSAMMIGYLAGIWAIPKYISQQKVFRLSTAYGLIMTCLVLLLPGKASIIALALLGLGNAILWPSIWPQALHRLQGAALAKASAILIMGIAGGALMPLWYGWLSAAIGNRIAYIIFIPAYLYMLYYSILGQRQKQ
jgi:glucose/galactose transporter